MEECTSTAYAKSAWETFGVTQTLAKIRLGVRVPPHVGAEAPRVPRAWTQRHIHADSRNFLRSIRFPNGRNSVRSSLAFGAITVWANRVGPSS